MIFHPDVLLELAREQEQDLIRQAERRRLYRQAERNQSGLLYRINQRVMNATQQMKRLTHLKPARPVFSRKTRMKMPC